MDTNDELQLSTPTAEGIDPIILDRAEESAGSLPNLQALLILRNGFLIFENYYSGANLETRFHLRSITKSIVSLLIGVAIEKGIIHSITDSVLDFIPEFKSRSDDPRKEDITIQHLLTMTSGFAWQETGAWFFDQSLTATNDALERPLAHHPGDVYNYDSASADLLTVILTRAAKQDAKSFLIQYLFAPLGITDFEWEQDPSGIYRGSAGLIMRPRDLAKIGQLLLDNGQWKGRQIVLQRWINESTADHVIVNEAVRYGYLWRSRRIDSIDHFYGMGYGGQYLQVLPSLKMVVVVHHDWNGPEEMVGQQAMHFSKQVFDPFVKKLSRLAE